MRSRSESTPSRTPIGTGQLSFVIVGSPRSGTTLIQRLVCELREVAVPPETHFLTSFVPRLLERGAPPFDENRILDEVQRWLSMDQTRGLQVDPEAIAQRLGGRCESIASLFEAVVRELVPADSVYGEKTPLHLLWWRPLTDAMPDLRVVAVVRDPHAVVASTLAVPWARSGLGEEWQRDAYAAVATRWSTHQDELLAMSSRLGSRCLILRYEDVVADPIAARSTLAGFLGVRDRLRAKVPRDIVLPWETWKAAALGDISPARVAAWRDELSRFQANVVTGICGGQMGRVGYDVTALERVRGRAALAATGPATLRRIRDYRARLRHDLAWIASVSL